MYDAVFKALKEELAVYGSTLGNEYKFISDWEQAEVFDPKLEYNYAILIFHQRNAFMGQFPDTLLLGCIFHFGQAIWRKVNVFFQHYDLKLSGWGN